MNLNRISKIATLVLYTQIFLIWYYLLANILYTAAHQGISNQILLVFLILGFSAVFIKHFPNFPKFENSLVMFLIFVCWVIIRYFLDFHNLTAISEVTIKTTGGIILFFVIGLLLREVIEIKQIKYKLNFLPLASFFLISWVYIFSQFYSRTTPEFFLTPNIEGYYQRSGNFISISYLIFTFLYFLKSINFKKIKNHTFLNLPNIIFTSVSLLCFLSAQLIGSNNAAVVVFFVFIISFAFNLSIINYHEFFYTYKFNQAKLKKIFIYFFKYFFMAGILFYSLIFVSLQYFGYNLSQLRLFGFGYGFNSSIISRIKIFNQFASQQLSYAPLLGNADVASITVKNSGNFIHSFLLNISTHLGLLGVLLITLFLYYVFQQFYKVNSISKSFPPSEFFANRALTAYSFVVFLFLFLLANIATEFTWIVFWFACGFFLPHFQKKL
jgi:hypothetical protein